MINSIISKTRFSRFQFKKFDKLQDLEKSYLMQMYNKDFSFSSKLFYFEKCLGLSFYQFTCPTCGNTLSESQVVKQFKVKSITYCSNKCAQLSSEVVNKRKETFLLNYGVDNPQKQDRILEKMKQTFIKNHGVDNPQKSSKVKLKIKQTFIKNHGVDNPQKLNQVIEKQIKTNRERYGKEWYSQTESCIKKRVATWKKNNHINYNVYNQLEQFYQGKAIQDEDYHKLLKLSNLQRSGFNKWLKLLNVTRIPLFYQKLEKEVCDFVKSLNDHVIENTKNIICPFELDLYIPELKLGIEFNGDWYHSIEKQLKNKDKQVNKTNLCEQKGIRLIHIWEHEWKNNQEFCKEIIKSYLEGKIPLELFQRENKLPRDYFSRLDFPECNVIEPTVEMINNRLHVYKTGYIKGN